MTVAWRPEREARAPYAGVLDGLVRGDHTMFVTGPEVEVAWRLVEPVLAAFREGRAKLAEYPAGSTGPEPDAACGSAERDG
jgi:glucose-6-phosphate 1-dehydrogenase